MLSVILAVFSFFIVTGPYFWNPLNVAWLVGGDSLQHYLGWAFYRSGPWTWPIGLNPLYGMEYGNSIVFTDSIPLLAIPFKLISSLLPAPFQYLGIWTLICFVFQSYFAFRLIGLTSNNLAIKCLGSILFLFAPPLLFRLGLHESLMGHFLILAALYLNLRSNTASFDNPPKYSRLLIWVALILIAELTHFYLFVMVFVLWLSDFCNQFFTKKYLSYSNALIEITVVVLGISIVGWQAGYLAVEAASGLARGFGDFRTNLLALFNSRGWSYFIRPIPLRDAVEAATGEGFQYLGAGTIFLLFSGIYGAIKRRLSVPSVFKLILKANPYLIVALMVLTAISFSNYVGIGPWNLQIPLPDGLVSALSIVRASSRLFWPLYYTVVLLIIWLVVTAYGNRVATILLLLSALLQVTDTSAGWMPIRDKLTIRPSSEFKTPLINSFWGDAALQYKKILVNGSIDDWGPLGILASSGMATNLAYLARFDEQKRYLSFSKVNRELHQGPLDQNALYIFQEWKYVPDRIQFDSEKDFLGKIDGIHFLAPGWKACKSCSSLSNKFELQQLAPQLEIGQVVLFTKAGEGRPLFMLNGWGYTEPWGTWAIQPVASIVMPLPGRDPKKILIKANAFLTPTHPYQLVDIVINGAKVAEGIKLNKQEGNSFEVSLPPGLGKIGEPVNIEFRSINAISPKDAGLSGDDRKLGIGLVSAKFIS